jgi:hypothetical protein
VLTLALPLALFAYSGVKAHVGLVSIELIYPVLGSLVMGSMLPSLFHLGLEVYIRMFRVVLLVYNKHGQT